MLCTLCFLAGAITGIIIFVIVANMIVEGSTTVLESPHRSGLERNPATANRGVDKLGLGCSQAFRPPHIANNSQRQKGGDEQGERGGKGTGDSSGGKVSDETLKSSVRAKTPISVNSRLPRR